MKIKWSKKASADLEKIFIHVNQNFNHELAFQVVEKLRIGIKEQLTKYPQSGISVNPNQPNRRILIVENNKVFYLLASSKLIIIVRINPRGTKG